MKIINNNINCNCEYCKNNLPFDLPEEIIEATKKGDIVIFAGAGISTESKSIFKKSLYEDIKDELNIKRKSQIDFPELMSLYCKKKNGRRLLLEKIRQRFEYCHQFSELYKLSTRFHIEISSIYSIDKIITTNWDDYFERECNAIPIVSAEDFSFYNIANRKVFKIHGSISNYGSIIASTEDYKRCYKNLKSGLIGSYIKTLLATKVVIFVGYSFSDFDFIKIYDYLKKEMKDIIPHIYLITLDNDIGEKIKKDNVTIINTDGVFFFSSLRKHLEGSNFILPKDNLEVIELYSYLINEYQQKTFDIFLKKKSISFIYNYHYQDGLRHALDYLKYHSKSGISFDPNHIMNSINYYTKIKKELLKYKNYTDYVYVEGYILGLHSIFLKKPKKDFPFHYIMGIGPLITKEFAKCLKRKSYYHKTAEQIGRKIFANFLKKDSNVILSHRPFIL